ncbi:MAG: decaprenyl-phosphate phosphoribosyltransferase [Sorangiineae bacterium NIC37A_2]|jgi:decaprenyl-phosphate phosphoribosyltransferase|nr:MAG: decaprenyl-phosphate phosphoribosyltransferase [Sorangiineae bacterium NIC37A_2]
MALKESRAEEGQSAPEAPSIRGLSEPGDIPSQVSWPAVPPAPAGPPSPGTVALGLIRTIRPHQWVKNVFVLAPVVFAKHIFEARLLTNAGLAFLVFCFLAGAIYTINDIADVTADREHPIKRLRPIPSGRVPLGVAKVFAAVLIVLAVGSAFAIDFGFGAVAAAYFILNLAYTGRLKHVAYLDVGCISAGFVLRVVGGGLATGIEISWYLYACTATLALFLGFGKRRHELTTAEAGGAKKQRAALEGYSKRGLNVAVVLSGGLTFVLYLVYTLDPRTREFFQADHLWLTSLFVAAANWRFLYLVRFRPKAESPTQIMLSDGPMVGIVLLWVTVVFWLVYHLTPGAA